MKKLKFPKDKEILAHVKWASEKIYELIESGKLEDKYFDHLRDTIDEIPGLMNADEKEVLGGISSVLPACLGRKQKGGILSKLDLIFEHDMDKISPQRRVGYLGIKSPGDAGPGIWGSPSLQKENSGILFHMYFPPDNKSYSALIQSRDSTDRDSFVYYDQKSGKTKKGRPHGWRRKGKDSIHRLPFYNFVKDQPYKPHYLFLQIAIGLVQEGFLTKGCIREAFKKYILENLLTSQSGKNNVIREYQEGLVRRRKEDKISEKFYEKEMSELNDLPKKWTKILADLDHEENISKSVEPDYYHDDTELSEDEEGSKILTTTVTEEMENKECVTRQKKHGVTKRVVKKIPKIDDQVIDDVLTHVVKNLSFKCLYNPTTFEALVRRVCVGKTIDYTHRIMGTPKKSYYKPRSNPVRVERKEIRGLICNGWTIRETKQWGLQKINTKKRVKEETARKRLQRWERKWTLDEIRLALY